MSVLQNRFLQVDLFFFYLTPYESIFSLLSLQYCSNLLSISSANVLIFQWKNLILYNFSFNWKVAPAAATFQPWKPMGCKCKYRTTLWSNWYGALFIYLFILCLLLTALQLNIYTHKKKTSSSQGKTTCDANWSQH